jgi:hypothetical protein
MRREGDARGRPGWGDLEQSLLATAVPDAPEECEDDEHDDQDE